MVKVECRGEGHKTGKIVCGMPDNNFFIQYVCEFHAQDDGWEVLTFRAVSVSVWKNVHVVEMTFWEK